MKETNPNSLFSVGGLDVPEHQLCVPQPRHAGAELRGAAGLRQEAEAHHPQQHEAGPQPLETGHAGQINIRLSKK